MYIYMFTYVYIYVYIYTYAYLYAVYRLAVFIELILRGSWSVSWPPLGRLVGPLGLSGRPKGGGCCRLDN